MLCYYIMYSIYYSTKDKYTFKCKKIFMWNMCFFKQLVLFGLFLVLCVCMCAVCVCVCVCVCACAVYVCVYVCMYVCMHACMHVCVCVFLLYFVFLVLFNQLPYLKFHNKIFTTNWSQIWAFFEDLLKYILSFKNCNTIWKKKEKITKKKKVISNKKIDTYDRWKLEMTTFHPMYLVYFCIGNSN